MHMSQESLIIIVIVGIVAGWLAGQVMQGTGFGRKLLAAAEQRARELYCEFIDIRVVNLREELPPFYRRLGYVECGTSEFTPGVRTLMPCHFLHMFKPLA